MTVRTTTSADGRVDAAARIARGVQEDLAR
jgi:hypothetical protein